MATQNCPGILQVEMRYKNDGQSIYNVFHVNNRTGALWEVADIEQMTNVFLEDYWHDAQRVLIPTNVALTEIVATDLTSLSGHKFSFGISPVEAGTNASAGLPANVTMAIKLSPALRGRGRAGRIFWPGLPEGEVTNNAVSSGYADDAVLAVIALKDGIDAIFGLQILSVLSRWNGGARRTVGEGLDVVNIGVTDLTVDSQKNRLPGHKRAHRNP